VPTREKDGYSHGGGRDFHLQLKGMQLSAQLNAGLEMPLSFKPVVIHGRWRRV
jgi:hypothetical protein